MQNQFANRFIFFLVFSVCYCFSGALGAQWHASVVGLVIIVSAYFGHKMNLSPRVILGLQSVPVLFVFGFIIWYQLFFNYPIMLCTIGAILLSQLGLKFTSQRLWFIISGLFVIAAGYYITAYSWYKEGNLTAIVNPIGFSATALTNKQQLPFQFPTNDTLYIVEVWSTSCGSCIKQMPEFAKLQLKYQNSKLVSFATLHLPVKGEHLSQALGILNRVDCQLPSYFATSTSSWHQLNIDAVPVVLMIRNQQIVKAFASSFVPILSFPLRPSIESEMLELLTTNE